MPDFAYLGDEVYLDSACQSLRPQTVLDALEQYYTTYNACGGRVKYQWGQKVDAEIESVRQVVLDQFKLPKKRYAVSFTLNTTYGINLILQQLPADTYSRIITSEIEHNSVFISTITAAKRLGIDRLVCERSNDGSLLYDTQDLEHAVVVVNAVSNIDGRTLTNMQQLIKDAHKAGGIVIIDAAQAAAHHKDLLRDLQADAICFSAHKMYGASLGVIIAQREFSRKLDLSYVGGGMVESVRQSSFTLTGGDDESRLEPGLQAYGEIIALGAAIRWQDNFRPFGQDQQKYLNSLSKLLFDGLQQIPGVRVFNTQASPVISIWHDKIDAHRLAAFLSAAKIMCRSGYFCCHYYLHEKLDSPPLLRLSLSLASTEADVTAVLDMLRKITGVK